MKRPSISQWFKNLSDEQKDILLGTSIVLLIAVVYYFQWVLYLTDVPDSKINLDDPRRYFWWANDSGTYRMTGEWLFGRASGTQISSRPWLYPFLLGFSRTIFGAYTERVMWFAQFLMWLASGAFIYLTLNKTTKSIILSIIGAMLFFVHSTPLILTFHGMTESLNIFLVAILCYLLAQNHENKLLYGILILSLLTVTKPIHQVQLALLALYFFARDVKFSAFQRIGLIALTFIPVWIQLLLTFIDTGKPVISTIGSYTFKNYLVAIVYSRINHTEWHPSMEAIKTWDTKEQLDYLWLHPGETLSTYRSNLIDSDLWTRSIFALGEGNRAADLAQTLNAAWTLIHLLMIPIMLYYLFSPKYKDKEFIALLYIGILVQTLLTGISRGQGDRLVLPMLPAWIIVYLVALNQIFSREADPKSG